MNSIVGNSAEFLFGMDQIVSCFNNRLRAVVPSFGFLEVFVICWKVKRYL